jgi:hypothetical protein
VFAGTRVPLKNLIMFEAPSNRLEHIRPLLPEAVIALHEMAPGELRVIRSSDFPPRSS